MALEAATARPEAARSNASRWGQLVCGIVCMVMIANLQYGWTLFVNPIDQKYHWGARRHPGRLQRLHRHRDLAGADRGLVRRSLRSAHRGRRSAASVSPSPGRSIPSPSSLWEFYVAAAISGIGAGAVYGTCVGNALKWFPDRRGLAAGLTAAGFGAGTAATVIPIRDVILGSRL